MARAAPSSATSARALPATRSSISAVAFLEAGGRLEDLAAARRAPLVRSRPRADPRRSRARATANRASWRRRFAQRSSRRSYSCFFQIGDGAMVLRRQGVYGVVFWPQSGEYANSTNFLTRQQFRKAARVRVRRRRLFRHRADDRRARTAGLAIRQSDSSRSFFRPFFPSPPGGRRFHRPQRMRSRRFLGSASVRERSDDDKTLILASLISTIDRRRSSTPSANRHSWVTRLGRGGEGSVYEVDGNPSLVVKVYHKTPLPDDQVAKLRAMSAIWSANLEADLRLAADDPVRSRRAQAVRPADVEDGRCPAAPRALRHDRPAAAIFPDVGWHHLVLAARNVAAAFNTLHAAGIVVGDVNQGNSARRQQDVRADDRLRFVPDRARRQDLHLPRRLAPLHAARVAGQAAPRRRADREPRSLRPGDADLSPAVRRSASVCRTVPRARATCRSRRRSPRAASRFPAIARRRKSIRRRRRCCSTTCRSRSAICSKRRFAPPQPRVMRPSPRAVDAANWSC